jgi:erythromycin esterase
MVESSKSMAKNRDQAMAENVQWILDHNPGAKMVIWAHNEHIRKAKRFAIPMGYYLNKNFGDEMVTIGFSTEEGTYTAVKKEKEKVLLLAGNKLLPSTEEDIEYYFKNATAHNFIIDFRKAKLEPSNTWISKKIRMRSIGARAIDKYQFLDTYLNNDFDMIIFLMKTTSSKCFRVL